MAFTSRYEKPEASYVHVLLRIHLYRVKAPVLAGLKTIAADVRVFLALAERAKRSSDFLWRPHRAQHSFLVFYRQLHTFTIGRLHDGIVNDLVDFPHAQVAPLANLHLLDGFVELLND